MTVQAIISYLTSVGVRYDYDLLRYYNILLRLATVLLEATTGSFLGIYQKIYTQGVAKCQIPLLNANIAPFKTRLPPDELYFEEILFKETLQYRLHRRLDECL